MGPNGPRARASGYPANRVTSALKPIKGISSYLWTVNLCRRRIRDGKHVVLIAGDGTYAQLPSSTFSTIAFTIVEVSGLCRRGNEP